MKKKKRGKKTKIDPVAVQVSVRAPRIPGVKFSPKLLEEVMLKWADTGEVPDGFEIASVEWENYGRFKERRYARDEESIEEARITLKLGQLFRGRFVRFQTLGARKGATR